MKDETSQTFGLPDCLLVPIAAATVGDIERHVGQVVSKACGRTGRVNAVCVAPREFPVKKTPGVKIWLHERAAEFDARLHPARQVWVHVDYSGYRRAYIRFGMPEIPAGHFLDHIQNREAVRLRGYSHPYLRLCPVSRQVNTSGGAVTGGEGMEKQFLRSLPEQPEEIRARLREALKCRIVYADPMDLTKMLDVAPGVEALAGVGNMMKLFYPE